MFEFCHYYCRPPSDVSNRLDALYNDTVFDTVEGSIRRSPYEFAPLGEVTSLRRESRNPQETPDEEFLYVDIASIDTAKGQARPEKRKAWTRKALECVV